MNRRIIGLVVALLVILLFSGCHSTKNEAAMIEDLETRANLFVEGTEITNLEIIKRLTDKASKTDTVYVNIKLDHEAATEERSYVLTFTEYNEGWLLDEVTPYYGGEGQWSLNPKDEPMENSIEQKLLDYSNRKLETLEAEGNLYFPLTGEYYDAAYELFGPT